MAVTKSVHYVYKLTEIDTGEFYYGSRSCNCNPSDDLYMGSMKTWKPDKSKLLKKVINFLFKTKDEALDNEAALIKKHINNPLNRNYHIPNKGFHALGLKHTNESRRKMSESSKGQIFSKEHREKIGNASRGVKMSDYTKSKISKSRLGIKFSDDTKMKISISKTGVKHNTETKIKMSNTRINYYKSSEARNKHSIRMKKWWDDRKNNEQ